jgi:uncharacterized protein YabN with tetrapyrrole methylase and pyrophosphatase domain
MPTGSLTIVGTGIQLVGHLTPEARTAFERAEEALYLVADPLTMVWLARLNPTSRSLHTLYDTKKTRLETYGAMVEEMLAPVRAGRRVCTAFYGHPGVFVYPAHRAIEQARSEGFPARMLPGISAIDCLFADLGIDPARRGCQIYHATDFLAHRSVPDPTATLILLQISVIGQAGYAETTDWSGLALLVEYLGDFYPPDHEVIAYEASPYNVIEPLAVRTPLSALAGADLTAHMTLVVPASIEPAADPTMLDRLGMPLT